jgi:hypothetical protein
MRHVSVSLTEPARDTLRDLTLELGAVQAQIGRRLTLSEVLIAMAKVSRAHPSELLAVLRAEGETPGQG